MFKVYEVFHDGKKFFRFDSEDVGACEVYIAHHRYDAGALAKGKSKLVILSE